MTVFKAGLLVLAGLFATPAMAAETIDPARIISAATGDWNQDGSTDLAMLVSPEEGSDADNGVYIYLASETGALELKSAIPNKVWGDLQMAGRIPSITALPNGSFTLTSLNDSVGRDRWEQTLTIAYRNFDFVVAGYTFTSRDTLDPEAGDDCDLNVLTGKGKHNGSPITAKAEIFFLKDWTDERGRSACGLE